GGRCGQRVAHGAEGLARRTASQGGGPVAFSARLLFKYGEGDQLRTNRDPLSRVRLSREDRVQDRGREGRGALSFGSANRERRIGLAQPWPACRALAHQEDYMVVSSPAIEPFGA